ncbi:MAG: hypothetical protein IMX01_08075 [Limnochordaceae bacterium]|nr:hypothetical protein [Limnochordaceae bacterium]
MISDPVVQVPAFAAGFLAAGSSRGMPGEAANPGGWMKESQVTTSSPDGTTAELLAGAWPVLYRNALELQNLATAFADQGRPAALNPSLPAGL